MSNQYIIKSYSKYIKEYIINYTKKSYPGEHHFVSTYLLERVIKIKEKVPDYINPDGMKKIPGGDLVWFSQNKYILGIEVKFRDAKLSKNEFEEWFIKKDSNKMPNIFIGISDKGIILLKWKHFIEIYEKVIGGKNSNQDGYGPACNINKLFDNQKEYEEVLNKEYIGFFKYDVNDFIENENSFMLELKRLIVN